MTAATLPALTRGQAVFRASVGLASLTVPRVASRLFGFPKADVTDGAIAIVGLFGVRELALAGFTLTADDDDPGQMRRVLLLNIAVDALDAVVVVALARRHPRLRAAAVMVVPAALGSVVANTVALRSLT